MRKTIFVAGAVLLLVIAAVGGWYALSPGWTVKAMMDAARDRDEAAFSAYIDYPALRADMKSELTARLQAQAKRDPGPQGRLGLAVGMALLGPMVDRLVSPKALEGAFTQLAGEKVSTGTSKVASAAKPSADKRMPEIYRQGFNRFLVASPDRPDAGLVFERRGLGWRLTGIDLPEERAVKADRS